MNNARLQPVHALVGNAPYIISVAGTNTLPVSRYFVGTGAPSNTTLAAGNGMYNAVASGFVVNAALKAAGTGSAVGDVLTVTGGTGTAAQITVAAVDGAGAITDWYLTRVGNYSVYPANPVAVTTSGAGSGMTFNLNFPAPDFYLDITTPTAPVLYVCTTSGSNGASVWAKISGGGGGGTYGGTYNNGTAYNVGTIVRVQSSAPIGSVTPTIGVYGCVYAVPMAGTGNQVPQYPEPTSGTVYWQLIAFGVQAIGICTGTSQSAYINASNPF